MLQLETGVGLELAEPYSNAVVLTEVVVRAISCGVLKQNALGVVLLGYDVYHTSYCIRTVKCRLCAFHYLDSLNIVRVDKT